MSGIRNRTLLGRPEVVLTLVVAALFLLGACGGGAGVGGVRAGFIAEMRSAKVLAPAADEGAMAEDAAAEDAAAEDAAAEDAAAEGAMAEGAMAEGAAAEGEEVAEGEIPAEPEMVNVLLDILIHNEGAGTLDGVTLDLTIAGSDGTEKEHRLLWVETAGLTKGSQSQVAYELEDVAYEEGDGFHVEVRYPIPMEERGDYREFDVDN